MQGDLISRQQAIDALRIYADQKCANGEVELANGILKAVCFLEKESNVYTAYDVEKVAEQLRNIKDLHEGLSKSEKLSKEDKHIHSLCHGLCVKVIDIVRKGGKE